ncbi:MAG: 3-demethylubiquinone-9 3-methyltransferase [Pedobacter sp.]|jgi:predicted 3-demethylubiquinone-9 3-methyltransferase (glyoxalase superfamily)|nr:3-demethylubiquinone-9 3-methyltransferase [Pedobacter sp.]
MKKSIYPCIWFNGNAKEAAELYCSAFPGSEIKSASPMVVTFNIEGKQFMGLNGGPQYTPNPSVSFFQIFEAKTDLEHAWNLLSPGGKIMMELGSYPWSEKYGWLEDKFGVSWQLMIGMAGQEKADVFPALMFTGVQAGKAAKAMDFYTSLFPDSSIGLVAKYEAGEHDTEGNIKHAQFYLNGYKLGAMDSSMGHEFEFNQGVSLVISCDTQEEIDFFWSRLTEGGMESRCGWCQDAFGLWWQVVPSALGSYMTDPAKAPKVMEAFMKMSKFNIAELEEAAT